MKKIIFSILLFSFAFIACTKENTSLPSSIEISEFHTSSVDESEFMTEDQYEFVGLKHNEYLSLMLTTLDLTNSTLTSALSLYDVMNNYDEPYFENYHYDSNSFLRSDSTALGILDTSLSDLGKAYLQSALNAIENFTDVNDFKSNMNQIITESRLNCTPNDFKILAVICTVFKYSSEFWAPTELGGVGSGYASLLLRHGNARIAKPFNWKNALISDGISGGVGCIAVAVGAAIATGPVGWGVLAICAGESAINSGIAGWL
ncbi:MAG: hypothetical protein ACK417_07340 [Bacteroidia bacterium]